MTRILIADDHEMIRDGLRRVIEETSPMTVVGEAASGAEAIELSKRLHPDVVVLDLVMPGRDSLEVVEDLKRRDPKVRILMLTALPEELYAMRCLRAGADGYLCKAKAGETLVQAINHVRRNGKYVSDTLAILLATSLWQDYSKPQHELLSDRESQVLRMIGAGRTISEIADELSLSVKTISTYRARILEKTGLRNNAEIIRYALKQGLVS